MLNCLKIVLVCLALVLLNSVADCLRITCSVYQSMTVYPKNSSFFNQFEKLSAIDPIAMGNVPNVELFLDHNIFEYLPGDLFDYNVNFTRLSFAENRITTIHPQTFRKLKELQSLYLQKNQLVEIDATLFRTNSKLEIIYLNDNKIKFFHPNTFEGLTGLIFLYANANQLTTFDTQLLTPLRRLEGFYLEKNNLTEISYTNLKEVVPLLGSLSLSGNYFNCSFASQVNDYLLRNEIENRNYHGADKHSNISCVSDDISVEVGKNRILETTAKMPNEVLISTESLEPREGQCDITFETMGKRMVESFSRTFEWIEEVMKDQKNNLKSLQLQLSKHQSIIDNLQKEAGAIKIK